MNRFAKASLVTLVVMLAATAMFAVSNPTASIAVTANINPSCLISANPLAFGSYDELGVNKTADLKQTTTITVLCVDEQNATVSLDQGLFPAAGSTPDAPQRQMQCPDQDSQLAYFLYQDSNYSQVWGANSSANTSIIADGQPHNYTVYGSIPHGQMGEAETYSDTVVATVLY